MKAYLSAREFSKVVKRDTKTVILWIKKGLIPGTKRVGHVYQIPASEIEVFQKSPEYPKETWQEQ